MPDKINVLLIDDHPMICRGISTLLAETDDIIVCAEAYDGRQAVALCEEHKPDIALVDIIMPEMDGIQTTQEMLARYPDMRVIALTSVIDETIIVKMINAGASGYLTKSEPLKRIAQMIRVVHDGYKIFPDRIMQIVMDSHNDNVSFQQNSIVYDLTRREIEVLSQLAEGYSNHEIAEELSLSVSTVKTHLVSIFKKLDVGSRTDAINITRKHNLI